MCIIYFHSNCWTHSLLTQNLSKTIPVICSSKNTHIFQSEYSALRYSHKCKLKKKKNEQKFKIILCVVMVFWLWAWWKLKLDSGTENFFEIFFWRLDAFFFVCLSTDCLYVLAIVRVCVCCFPRTQYMTSVCICECIVRVRRPLSNREDRKTRASYAWRHYNSARNDSEVFFSRYVCM